MHNAIKKLLLLYLTFHNIHNKLSNIKESLQNICSAKGPKFLYEYIIMPSLKWLTKCVFDNVWS